MLDKSAEQSFRHFVQKEQVLEIVFKKHDIKKPRVYFAFPDKEAEKCFVIRGKRTGVFSANCQKLINL